MSGVLTFRAFPVGVFWHRVLVARNRGDLWCRFEKSMSMIQ